MDKIKFCIEDIFQAMLVQEENLGNTRILRINQKVWIEMFTAQKEEKIEIDGKGDPGYKVKVKARRYAVILKFGNDNIAVFTIYVPSYPYKPNPKPVYTQTNSCWIFYDVNTICELPEGLIREVNTKVQDIVDADAGSRKSIRTMEKEMRELYN